jgi:8-oxo-dGTP diphosphatase
MDQVEHTSLGSQWYARAAFCLLCGSPLEVRDLFGLPRPACTRCDFILFRSPAPASAAVVVDGRHLLLVERAIEPYRGAWGFPAGFQEYGETPAEAAVRETREETGLEIHVLRVLDLVYTKDDPRKRANLAVYLARAVAGELCPADDARDARFFDLDDLPEPIAFENNRAILSRLRQQFPHGDIV